jgi:hypothetical protein
MHDGVGVAAALGVRPGEVEVQLGASADQSGGQVSGVDPVGQADGFAGVA